MPNNTKDFVLNTLGINPVVYDFVRQTEKELAGQMQAIDEIAEYNQIKALAAMQKNKLSDIHFAATTGYGYNDLGRDVLEKIYADVFRTEAALVRPQIISGTHALTVAIAGNLKYGDGLFSPCGAPYDTLQGVIGIRETKGSLIENGILYSQTELDVTGGFDYPAIKKAVTPKTKMAILQRSKGYAWRKSFTVKELGEAIAFIKACNPNVICLVDNCYGEFVDYLEPSDVGADITVGSLIKNPGGGLAPVGGYIAGKEEYIE
ncbi:MAG: methionine gamma-lyase family protein, partial [Clostridiales bacterium]|nr:methionine gamma-lyase family protein [Clostridiales bacterium]